MPTPISNIFNIVTQHLLRLTLYDMVRSSHDFEDVRAVLNDRTNWSIELFRSFFTIQLTTGSYFFKLCTLSFLVMTENVHIHYARLSPAELKERVESMGFATFAIMFAVLEIGFVIVRIAGLVVLSGTPRLATSLVLVSMLPPVILPLFAYPAKLLNRRKHGSGEGEVEAGIVMVRTDT